MKTTIYTDRKGNYFYLDENGTPTKIFYVGDACTSRTSSARFIDTLRKNAEAPSMSCESRYEGSHAFDAAYDRIMQENWDYVSQFADQMEAITRESASAYRMWDVEVRCDNALAGVFNHMQPTLGKVYHGALGRYGLTIVLENGKPLCLRDGDFAEVRVVKPRFTIAW